MKEKTKQTPSLAIQDGMILTMNEKMEVIENGTLEVTDGKISYVGKKKKTNAKKILDAKNSIVMPGLVNGHTHTGMTLLRGIGDDLPLNTWLRERIFPLERKWGNEKFVYLGTLLATLEMIKSGTTLFNDMYYFEEQAARAVHLSGMRALCGQTIVDISGVEETSEIIGKFEKYRESVSKFSLVVPVVAPHSIYGVSEKSWPSLIDFARKYSMPMHVHLSEMQDEQDDYIQKKGKSPTELFEDYGLWDGTAIAAHAVCVNEKDIEILGRHKVGISHNIESNLKLGTKICPVSDLRKAGARVALGTDGTASNNNLDLFQEADMAAKLQVLRYGVGVTDARAICRMLTIEGASALGMGDITGSLEVGKSADFISVSVDSPHATPLYDPFSHLVYGAGGADVRHSVVNGKILMKDRKVLSLDEEKILLDARRWGKKIAQD